MRGTTLGQLSVLGLLFLKSKPITHPDQEGFLRSTLPGNPYPRTRPPSIGITAPVT
jgi:hypothetical protein